MNLQQQAERDFRLAQKFQQVWQSPRDPDQNKMAILYGIAAFVVSFVLASILGDQDGRDFTVPALILSAFIGFGVWGGFSREER